MREFRRDPLFAGECNCLEIRLQESGKLVRQRKNLLMKIKVDFRVGKNDSYAFRAGTTHNPLRTHWLPEKQNEKTQFGNYATVTSPAVSQHLKMFKVGSHLLCDGYNT